MSDFVWVKLDRDEAESLVGSGPLDRSALFRGHDKIRAALSEPSENQVEKVAAAIRAEFPAPNSWSSNEWAKQGVYRNMARAAVAVLFGEQEKP